MANKRSLKMFKELSCVAFVCFCSDTFAEIIVSNPTDATVLIDEPDPNQYVVTIFHLDESAGSVVVNLDTTDTNDTIRRVGASDQSVAAA